MADYKPPEDCSDHLALTEGQVVQVLDDANSELWLCRLVGQSSKQVSSNKKGKKNDFRQNCRERGFVLSFLLVILNRIITAVAHTRRFQRLSES